MPQGDCCLWSTNSTAICNLWNSGNNLPAPYGHISASQVTNKMNLDNTDDFWQCGQILWAPCHRHEKACAQLLSTVQWTWHISKTISPPSRWPCWLWATFYCCAYSIVYTWFVMFFGIAKLFVAIGDWQCYEQHGFYIPRVYWQLHMCPPTSTGTRESDSQNEWEQINLTGLGKYLHFW